MTNNQGDMMVSPFNASFVPIYDANGNPSFAPIPPVAPEPAGSISASTSSVPQGISQGSLNRSWTQIPTEASSGSATINPTPEDRVAQPAVNHNAPIVEKKKDLTEADKEYIKSVANNINNKIKELEGNVNKENSIPAEGGGRDLTLQKSEGTKWLFGLVEIGPEKDETRSTNIFGMRNVKILGSDNITSIYHPVFAVMMTTGMVAAVALMLFATIMTNGAL